MAIKCLKEQCKAQAYHFEVVNASHDLLMASFHQTQGCQQLQNSSHCPEDGHTSKERGNAQSCGVAATVDMHSIRNQNCVAIPTLGAIIHTKALRQTIHIVQHAHRWSLSPSVWLTLLFQRTWLE